VSASAPKEDPGTPAFWEKRYREHTTPWDAGRVPDLARAFIGTLAPRRRVLIPGCGKALDARTFAEAGHDVIAIDFSAAALETARAALGEWAHILRLEDFFTMDPGDGFDIVYERAFLCALPRRLWPGYAPRVAELLRPAGQLAGFFFWQDSERGPPFGLKPGELESLLEPAFGRTADSAVTDSIPVFQGKERWQVWLRNPGYRPA
jgi:SAM-dependent methyltransferase